MYQSVPGVYNIRIAPTMYFVQSFLFHIYLMLIQTVYRALLTSAVSGSGHQVHTLLSKCTLLMPV